MGRYRGLFAIDDAPVNVFSLRYVRQQIFPAVEISVEFSIAPLSTDAFSIAFASNEYKSPIAPAQTRTIG
jgi:hypothetical protein